MKEIKLHPLVISKIPSIKPLVNSLGIFKQIIRKIWK